MDTHDFSIWFFLLKIIVGGVASFWAIFYLSKTRELAWIFIIVGTLLLYVQIIFETLSGLEIISFDMTLFGVDCFEIISIIINILPLLFFTLGFISVAGKHR